MDTEELGRAVVKEVLRRLQPGPSGICVKVLAERSEDLQSRIQSLVSPLHEESVELAFWGECCSGRVPAHIILPELTCTGMADLANGRAGGCRYLKEVLRCLLAGERVEVLEYEYRRYAATAPDPLYKLYASYEEKLKGYGLVAFQEKRPEAKKVHDALITSSMVEEAHAEGCRILNIPEKTIVTPLARETAAALGVSIER